jgi:hypothetical protein
VHLAFHRQIGRLQLNERQRRAHLAGGGRVGAAEARMRKQGDAGHEAKASNLLGSEQGELGELLW